MTLSAWFSHTTAAVALMTPLTVLAAPTPIFDGPAYKGEVTLGVVLPDGEPQTKTTPGSIQFGPTPEDDGTIQMRMFAEDDGAGASSELIVFGSYVDGGWLSRDLAIDLSVTPEGHIEGRGDDGERRFQFAGTVSPTRLQLNNEVYLITEQGGAPAGTRLTYTYVLQRAASASPAR